MKLEPKAFNLRSKFRRLVDGVGIGQMLRQKYVDTRLLGERLKFSLHGRPDTSTTILLAGSGRSGTTWLQEMLCAIPGTQPIFEPLHPEYNSKVRHLTGWEPRPHYFREWYLPDNSEQPEWTSLLVDILRGIHRNYWTDHERYCFFPDRFLVKEIRANLMLGYIYQHFKPKIIYITRHPCSVVHSRLAVNWLADTKDILKQEHLVEDHLRPWVAAIEKERDILGAHAAWWAIENMIAKASLENVPHFNIRYEDLVLQPEESVHHLFDWLGSESPPKLKQLFARPSRMSNSQIDYKSKVERLSVWKKRLSLEQQTRILQWSNRLGVDAT